MTADKNINYAEPSAYRKEALRLAQRNGELADIVRQKDAEIEKLKEKILALKAKNKGKANGNSLSPKSKTIKKVKDIKK